MNEVGRVSPALVRKIRITRHGLEPFLSFAVLASPTATNYTDTAVTYGTAYFYVVSAVNTTSESANSAQVTAINGQSLSGTAKLYQVTAASAQRQNPVAPVSIGTMTVTGSTSH